MKTNQNKKIKLRLIVAGVLIVFILLVAVLILISQLVSSLQQIKTTLSTTINIITTTQTSMKNSFFLYFNSFLKYIIFHLLKCQEMHLPLQPQKYQLHLPLGLIVLKFFYSLFNEKKGLDQNHQKHQNNQKLELALLL